MADVIVSDNNQTAIVSNNTQACVVSQPQACSSIIQAGTVIEPHFTSTDTGIMTLTAGAVLSGHKAIIDNCTYADNTTLDHIHKVIGVTGNAANAGYPVAVYCYGKLSGFSGLSLGPIYLGMGGTLTQSIPTTGFILQLGVAVSSTEVIINISTPILQV